MAAKQVEAQGDFDFQTSTETEIAEWENYTRGCFLWFKVVYYYL
jgi:hypothetical protein